MLQKLREGDIRGFSLYAAIDSFSLTLFSCASYICFENNASGFSVYPRIAFFLLIANLFCMHLAVRNIMEKDRALPYLFHVIWNCSLAGMLSPIFVHYAQFSISDSQEYYFTSQINAALMSYTFFYMLTESAILYKRFNENYSIFLHFIKSCFFGILCTSIQYSTSSLLDNSAFYSTYFASQDVRDFLMQHISEYGLSTVIGVICAIIAHDKLVPENYRSNTVKTISEKLEQPQKQEQIIFL